VGYKRHWVKVKVRYSVEWQSGDPRHAEERHIRVIGIKVVKDVGITLGSSRE
jgi:hypothetical protein